MKCSEVQEMLSAYCDGELADAQRSRLSDHLRNCSDCAEELAGFERLSEMAKALSTPVPPKHSWKDLEQQLDQQSANEMPVAESVNRSRSLPYFAPKMIALAAAVLVAVGIGWFTYPSWFTHSEHGPFTAEFGHYLDEFRHDPDAAQQILLANYQHQVVDLQHAVEQVGYRPAVADGLPQGYTLESTHVMKMPCCTCVQSICNRRDGSTLAIFEHDDEETTEWFGDRSDITAQCSGKQCCLVELDDQIAASWKRGTRHITLIGVRDVAEVSLMVAWLDEKKRPVPN